MSKVRMFVQASAQSASAGDVSGGSRIYSFRLDGANYAVLDGAFSCLLTFWCIMNMSIFCH